jgi:hypothetical protein
MGYIYSQCVLLHIIHEAIDVVPQILYRFVHGKKDSYNLQGRISGTNAWPRTKTSIYALTRRQRKA